MIDLEKGQLLLVQNILKQHVPGCEVWAFGSRVNGTATRFSDLDIVLMCECPLDWGKLEGLKDAFSASELPIIVDVLDWHVISESFRQLIKKEYEVVQSATAGEKK